MTSTTSKRHRMRCNACRAAKRGSGRFTLPRPPEQYKRAVRCPSCGETERLVSQEQHRRDEFARRPSHKCASYPFPHRPGSLRLCTENSDYIMGIELTEDEQHQYQSVLDTPRSAFDWGNPEEIEDVDYADDDFEVPF